MSCRNANTGLIKKKKDLSRAAHVFKLHLGVTVLSKLASSQPATTVATSLSNTVYTVQ